MSEIRALNELGLELDRVIRAQPRAAGRVAPRAAVVLAAVALAAGAGAAVAGLLPIGPAVKGPHVSEVPPRLRPVPATSQIAPVRAADPFGGDPWSLRVASTRTGGRCAAIGRLREHVFGTVAPDGSFRPLPLLGTGTCGDLTTDATVVDLAVTRTPRGVVTALGGVTRVPIARLSARVGQRALPAQHAGAAFLVVARGNESGALRADAQLADGTQVTLYQGK